MDFCQRTPDIDYPCTWTYKVIGEDEDALRRLVGDLLADLDHSVALSNKSSKGRYTSLTVDVRVVNEVQRKSLFEVLAHHPDVKLVL